MVAWILDSFTPLEIQWMVFCIGVSILTGCSLIRDSIRRWRARKDIEAWVNKSYNMASTVYSNALIRQCVAGVDIKPGDAVILGDDGKTYPTEKSE